MTVKKVTVIYRHVDAGGVKHDFDDFQKASEYAELEAGKIEFQQVVVFSNLES